MNRFVLWMLLAICAGFLLGGLSLSVVATGYDITDSEGVDLPEEEVTIVGSSYTVDHITVLDPGDPIEVEIEASTDYEVYLYNVDADREFTVEADADTSTVTMGTDDDALDTADLPAGTYMLALETSIDREERHAIHPVVIEGYDMQVDGPDTVSQGEKIEVTVTVDAGTLTETPDEVGVTIWNEDAQRGAELDRDGGEYSGTIDSNGLEPDDYSLYAVVPGDDTVEGYDTVYAVGTGDDVTIEDDAGGGAGGQPPQDNSDDSDDEENASNETDSNESTDIDENESTTDDSELNGDGTDSDDGQTSDSNEVQNESPQEEDDDTDSEIAQPNQPNGSDDTDDQVADESGTAGLALIALTLIFGFVWYRSN